jgi:hypothetical protein
VRRVAKRKGPYAQSLRARRVRDLARGGKGARTDKGFFTLTTAQWVNYFAYMRFELGGRVS